MESTAALAAPRLGDTFHVFTDQLGTPRYTTTAQGCVVRRYAWTHGMLTVLFVQGRSVALHVPASPLPSADAQGLMRLFAPEGPQSAYLLSNDELGWVLANAACSDAMVQLLRALSIVQA